MFRLFKSVFVLLLLSVFTHMSYAQAPSTGPAAGAAKQAAPPAKSAPASGKELNGYKKAAWGMSKDDVESSLHIDFSHSEPHYSVIDLPWEILRLAAISESGPDDLLSKDLVWFYGERQDVIFGFYKDRFFSYTSSLDKILPVSDYRQRIISIHGGSSNYLSFQDTDPAEEKVVGTYDLEIWEKKKSIIVLGMEKLFPGPEPVANYEITYLGADIFAEFKNDAAHALEQSRDEEAKQSEKLLQEQQSSALEVIQ
ncbi:MAG: hypothetical protein Q7R35_04410 [Elusimicrobiota bacterium]|nr:hypothetical protein [Elusimicrobiota bacterium]